MVVVQENANKSSNIGFSYAGTPVADSVETLNDIFTRALSHHQAGELLEAEALYLKVLEVEPNEPNTNNNLGMLKLSENQVNASLHYFKTALEADSEMPQYWVNYVDALIEDGQLKLATEVLMNGLELGLHGEEVNALVDILIESQKPVTTLPVEIRNNAISYPNNPQIQQALTLQQSGKLDQAKKQYTKLLKLYPKHPQILTALGTIALQQGDIETGVSLLEQSLNIEPNQTTALSAISIGYISLKFFDQAITCCDRAITINPNYVDAYANRANALKQLGRFDEAIASYQKAIELKPNDADNNFNLGVLFKELKQYQHAALSFQQAIAFNPKDVEAYENCAAVLQAVKEFNASYESYTRAIGLNSNNSENYYGRGLVNLELERFDDARADFEHAIKLNPKNADTFLNLGVVLLKLGQVEDALRANDFAIKLNPNSVQAYNNRGLMLLDQCRFDEAMADYDQAIAIDSAFQYSYWNKSILNLLRGDYLEGWKLYESRWNTILKDFKRFFAKPLWLGEQPITGKTLLIHPEQGFGDYIQFCRYISSLEALGAKVILEVPKILISVVSSLKGDFTIVEQGFELPDFDFHCPMMSLPLALKTTVNSIPSDIPYLYANESQLKHWQNKLGPKTKLRVGLVWSGSTVHKNDRYRSIRLEMLKPILSLPAEFHVLQKEIREHDIQVLSETPNIQSHQNELIDFSDTSALIEAMDLVITVDTSVAHLAGALGKKCWVLLPFSPDFRWMLDRTDSPWYPSVTLFRQPKSQDWASVIRQVELSLDELLKATQAG